MLVENEFYWGGQMTDSEIVRSLNNEFGDSFYVFDKEKLRENYSNIFNAFTSRYTNFIIGYSYKTNYVPSLIKEMSKLGAYAEVVSRLEYDLAIKIGVEPAEIIFNGPYKRYEDIALALDGNSLLNLDSFYEVDLVKRYVLKNKERKIKVGLRVSFDLNADGSIPLQYDVKGSRFGFFVENGNLEQAIKALHCIPNIEIVGLHSHFSTTTRSLKVYQKITQMLCDLSLKYLAETIEYIDIGGGFYGQVPKSMTLNNVPSFDDYAETICKVIKKEKERFKKSPVLIIEPGLAMVVDTFKFYCKVIDVKISQDEYFILVEGSIHNIKPTMHAMNMPMSHVKKNEGIYHNGKFNVVGYTCMEKDYLAVDHVGEIPKPGDFLVFSNVGAYTIVFAPPFIKERPPIVEKVGSEFKLVRKREKLDDFINDQVYIF